MSNELVNKIEELLNNLDKDVKVSNKLKAQLILQEVEINTDRQFISMRTKNATNQTPKSR